MDLRSDLIPPVLALTLSLVAHGAIFRWHPPLPQPDESPPETVELRYLPAPEQGPVTPAPSEPPPSEPPPEEARKTATPPTTAPEAVTVDRETPPPEPAAPAPKTPPRSTPAPQAVAAAKPPPITQPTVEPAPLAPPARPVVPPSARARPLPTLAQLLPGKQDFDETSGTTAPDPAADDATEATLQLGTQDLRYRGYLGGVRSAVDRSWRWREALLAAGAPGSVVIRFTLVAAGGVDEVTVVTSSGNPILDQEAVATVRRADLPPFPAAWTIQRLNLVAQFDYRFE